MRNFTAVAYLKASNPGLDDHLGFGSALSGRTLALSRDGNALGGRRDGRRQRRHRGIDGDQKDDSAATRAPDVFTRAQAPGDRGAAGYIKASNTDAYDSFGLSVALGTRQPLA
jgi:hypothetical protein